MQSIVLEGSPLNQIFLKADYKIFIFPLQRQELSAVQQTTSILDFVVDYFDALNIISRNVISRINNALHDFKLFFEKYYSTKSF